MGKLKIAIAVLVPSLIIVGVFLSRSDQGSPTESALKTCVEMNGYLCEVGEECGGDRLETSDTFRCCNCSCGVQEELLTVDPFELDVENEELGDPF